MHTKMEKKSSSLFNSKSNDPAVGDILEDRHGNKMVILDVLAGESGECYVLLNGRHRLVNTQSPYIIKVHKSNKANLRRST